ncbi:hypothetical protein [Alkalicoccus daliensis]|uniref:DUF3899 domain-containing protein n=1 Tax=Alkalicoccus daliensis TaxID=745820 RepID=A0A1H0E441_9BACI|nr:hypothetical protein [Alkalicoccus daliensis]SDN77182.1 hypothetical protein SAMN04488053_103199 [Alkalicoccus daliensis]
MKNLIIGIITGAVAAAGISAFAFTTDYTNLFLLFLVAAGIFAFLPLIIRSITTSKVPRPTIYGTKAPKKFKTIETNTAEKEENNDSKISLRQAMVSAGAGAGLLVVFFTATIIYLQ